MTGSFQRSDNEKDWLGDKDSNLGSQIQSPTRHNCHHKLRCDITRYNFLKTRGKKSIEAPREGMARHYESQRIVTKTGTLTVTETGTTI